MLGRPLDKRNFRKKILARLDSLSRGRNSHAWRAAGHAVPFYEPRAETD